MYRTLWTLCALLGAATVAQADSLHLTNGDVLNGNIVTVTKTHVTLRSETLGELKLDRAKVRSLHFGDGPVAPPAAGPNAPPPVTADAALQKLLGVQIVPPGAGGATPEDVVRRLRADGVGANEMKQLKQQFPLLATPGAGGYFNEMVSGLANGSKDIQDLRRDAVRARDELDSLKKELGAPGAALNGYLGILNHFIDQVPERSQAPAPGNANVPPN